MTTSANRIVLGGAERFAARLARRGSQFQIDDAGVFGTGVDEVLRIGSRCTPGVSGVLEGACFRKPEHAATRLSARGAGVLNAYCGVEPFVVVATGSGLGRAMGINERINF